MRKVMFLLILLSMSLCQEAGARDRPARRLEAPRPDCRVDVESLLLDGVRSPEGLDQYIESVMNDKHIPGLSGALFKDKRLIWTGAFGYADISKNKLVTEDTLFLLASVTKVLTGTVAMQLYDQGLFDYHDSVNAYLPFPVHHAHHPQTEITVFMLLAHTSGIKDNWNVMPYYPGDSPIPLGIYLEDYLTPAGAYYNAYRNFYTWQPGTDYGYSNIAVGLLGYFAEAVSGTNLEDCAQQNLFGPLGMQETSYFLANLNADHIAVPYYWNGVKYVEIGHYGFSDYPSGQARTSATQLIDFLWNFWRNRVAGGPPGTGSGSGGLQMQRLGPFAGLGPSSDPGSDFEFVRFLEPETAAAMITPQIDPIDPDQGLIWYEWTLNDRTLWGHAGGDLGATTEMWLSPDENTGAVVLTNGESYFDEIIHALFEYAETQ